MRTSVESRSIATDALKTLGLRVLVYGISVVATILVSRLLGPEGRGMYYLPVVAAGTIAAIGKLGLEQANVFLSASRRVPYAVLSGQNGLVALVAGAGGFLLLINAQVVLPQVFSTTPSILLILAALTIPLTMHQQLTAGIQQIRGEITLQFRAQLAAACLQVALLMMLALLGRVTVVSALAVNLVAGGTTWALTVRRLFTDRLHWIRYDPRLLAASLRHSILLHVGMVLLFLHLRADTFLVSGLAGLGAVGQYSLAVALAESLLLASDSLSIAVLPRQMSRALLDAATLALRGARIAAVLIFALGIAWLALGDLLIRLLFGSAFDQVYSGVVALIPGVAFLGMQRFSGPIVLRTGNTRRFCLIYAIGLLANLTTGFVLIPIWGVVGAALASSGSYAVTALLFLQWTANVAGQSLLAGLTPRRSDLDLAVRAVFDLGRLARGLRSG